MAQFIHFSCKKYDKKQVDTNKNMRKSRYFHSINDHQSKTPEK